MSSLGRREPTDFKHVEKYPIRLMGKDIALMNQPVEKKLSLPRYHLIYDQGAEGACVGFGSSWMMSILNRKRYDCRWLYQQAQVVDEWDDTPPEEGTSVRAAMDVLRTVGHRWVYFNKDRPPNPADGISANRWATTVDEMRVCIASDIPITIGVNWYSNFDRPVEVRTSGIALRHFIGRGDLGYVRGGHCVCVFGASDHLQAFCFTNNWGASYPQTVWMPYEVMQRLLNEYGEAAIVTDR